MRELSQIRDAVVSALAAEGMAALDAYPDQRARRYGCPVAAVAVETAESRTVGFCARSSIPGPAHRGSCMESSWRR